MTIRKILALGLLAASCLQLGAIRIPGVVHINGRACRNLSVIASGYRMRFRKDGFAVSFSGGGRFLTAELMVVYFYVNQSRQTLLTFKSAAGLWRQDRWKPIVAGAVNLALNIVLVVTLPDAYKLDGVILSTIVGYVFIQIPWESHVVFTAFFDRHEARAYWRQQALFVLVAFVLCAAAWWLSTFIPLPVRPTPAA